MNYLACDLGAESGRVMLGALRDDRLAIDEIHRFPNTPLTQGDSLVWDVERLFAELKLGLKKAAQRGVQIASLSCDSWGVDYLLFDSRGKLMPPVCHYRDARRSARGVERAYAKVTWETIFSESGIQFMPINTLFQLAAEEPSRLEAANQLLLAADGFHYLLCGIAKAEESLASTSQLYNPQTRAWSQPLLDALRLPLRLFPQIVPSGAALGPLRDAIARETGLGSALVVAGCSHDTAAAVAAAPASRGHWAYISSGTWSLLGVETAFPIINRTCRELNFTNEVGYGGTIRLLKNIVGLWVVQECRREWQRRGSEWDYATLTAMAGAAPAFVSFIDPTDPRFVAPGEMPQKIAAFCRETGQPVPADPGATIRCVLESLAFQYRRTLQQVERLTGSRVQRLHIVGGGSKNALLNQLTANAVQIPVLAGPAEATAAGNILAQAMALGHLPSLAAARAVIARSTELAVFEPRDTEASAEACVRFEELLQRRSNAGA